MAAFHSARPVGDFVRRHVGLVRGGDDQAMNVGIESAAVDGPTLQQGCPVELPEACASRLAVGLTLSGRPRAGVAITLVANTVIDFLPHHAKRR